MITKDIAVNSPSGTTFYHGSLLNRDGTPARCRVTGKCKTWKTRPNDFKLPVKHGLYNSFYITPENAADWFIDERDAVANRLPKRVRIVRDEYANPPEDDGIKLALFHNRYALPNDEGLTVEGAKWLESDPDYIVLAVYGYDHGGLDISTKVEPYWWHYSWDGGQLGVAYVKYSYAVEAWGQPDKDNIREQIRGYVAEWGAYLRGDVYGIVLEIQDEDGEWNVEDSVWGYYGYDAALAAAAIDHPGIKIVGD